MEYLGALLRSTREKKHLSLDEVYKYTKIPKEILNNIESDRISTLTPAYLKGYLKIYAKYLGLDTATVLGAYKNILPYEAKSVLAPNQTRKSKETTIFAQFNFTLILNSLVVLFLLFSSVIFIKHMANKKRTKNNLSVVSSKVSAKIIPLTKKSNLPQVTQKKASPQAPEKFADIKLAILAKENTYLRVIVDSNTMFQGTLKKGQTEKWIAKNKVELSIGSVGNIDLELNGKLVRPLGRKNQPIHYMLINRDGSIQSK